MCRKMLHEVRDLLLISLESMAEGDCTAFDGYGDAGKNEEEVCDQVWNMTWDDCFPFPRSSKLQSKRWVSIIIRFHFGARCSSILMLVTIVVAVFRAFSLDGGYAHVPQTSKKTSEQKGRAMGGGSKYARHFFRPRVNGLSASKQLT